MNITLEKVVTDEGKEIFSLKGFDMLEEDEVPKMYKDSDTPAVWRLGPDCNKFSGNAHFDEHFGIRVYHVINTSYTKDEAERLIATLKLCKKNLNFCKKKLKKQRKDWHGEVTIHI